MHDLAVYLLGVLTGLMLAVPPMLGLIVVTVAHVPLPSVMAPDLTLTL